MDNLLNKKISGWLTINEDEKNNINIFSKNYIEFLNKSKTERETVNEIKRELENNGFKNINEKKKLEINDKIYFNNRNKSIYAMIIGKENIYEGLNIIASHIDSPRLDLKPNPIYEEEKLCLFKTHYYGGIKKYQWTTIPLSLHGIIILKNNKKIEINIGENDNDPIFTITDLLPHLSSKQLNEKIENIITGENLNILVGSIPNKNNSIKENILNILYDKYQITEKDLISAEIELTPAFKARELGFDKSMIAAYGQDDRVCTYSLLEAFINSKETNTTKVAIFTDKEEIGSTGNTGMFSNTFDYFINNVLDIMNINKPGVLNKIYNNSKMLSADVGAGTDPNYKEVFEEYNTSYIGYGIEINKYTGSKGKNNASDANSEYISFIREILEENNILYQVSELGKIDVGGGGTIAYILANKGIDVLDCGIPVLSMHSPYEVTSKFDIYEAYKFYKIFFENEKKLTYYN